MTNTVALKKKIDDSGYKIDFLAKKIGISRASLSMKINNQSSFKAEEMYTLNDLVDIDDAEARNIFFNGV